jgi:type II secretory pathway pseudopilin PulG
MRPPTRRRERGLTILETTVSLGVLVVAAVGVTRSVVGSMSMTRSNREVSVATQAGRRMVEELRQADFAEVFRRYNATGADDPGGPDTAPGHRFAVPGLALLPGDTFAGEVLFPTPVGQPHRLTESAGAPFTLLAPDMNVNGVPGEADVTADHVLLPVVVRVRWRSLSGDREVSFRTVLSGN